jgi:hypothetical protein
MGYSYDQSKRLCCDDCGKAGGVRKRRCPYRVLSDSSRGPRHEMDYCSPPALCAADAQKAGKTLHAQCAAAAAAAQQEFYDTERRMSAGDLKVVAARCGEPGWTVVTFAGPYIIAKGVDWREYVMPEADYRHGGFLSDYPTAVTAVEFRATVELLAVLVG